MFFDIHDTSIFELHKRQSVNEVMMNIASYRKTLLKFCKVSHSYSEISFEISFDSQEIEASSFINQNPNL